VHVKGSALSAPISLATHPKLSSREHLSIYTLHGQPLFFQHFDGPYVPTLRLVHKCNPLYYYFAPPLTDLRRSVVPSIVPALQVDRGAIRFLLSGAHMMCPGFTSKGGRLPPAEEALPAGTVVAILTEGKEHPAAMGITKFSTEDIKRINKDVGVEVQCFLGDDLWAIGDKL